MMEFLNASIVNAGFSLMGNRETREGYHLG